MSLIKIFTMQKNEYDILEDWIIYHGNIVGYNNLYIIDNFSNKESIDILDKYRINFNINWKQCENYCNKGNYIYNWINEYKYVTKFAIPLDIDEFIGFIDINKINDCRYIAYDIYYFDYNYYINTHPQILQEVKNKSNAIIHYLSKGFRLKWNVRKNYRDYKNIDNIEIDNFLKVNIDLFVKYLPEYFISFDHNLIINYFENLPIYSRYATKYYLTSRNEFIDYNDSLIEINTFDLIDNSIHKINSNKKFFNPKTLLSLDHGNHHGKVSDLSSNICKESYIFLMHFHNRGVRKLIEKCIRDIEGLYYVNNITDINDIEYLKTCINKNVIGSHNILTYITYLQYGPNSLCFLDDECIKTSLFSDKIKKNRQNLL